MKIIAPKVELLNAPSYSFLLADLKNHYPVFFEDIEV